MPIKQLQLRGISRTPSDRSVADGGCAESLNVHLDQQETAPTLPPVDISSAIYGSASTILPIVYIHKMNGITNYIGYGGTYPRAYGSRLGQYGDNMGNAYINGVLKHVTSVGNMLIMYTGATPHYFLFKDSGYVYLGTSVPKPIIEVGCYENTSDNVYAEITDEVLKATNSSAAWNAASNPNDEHYSGLLSAMSGIWDAISVKMAQKRSIGGFVAPFFIRYALRLYDGTYIHCSCPILCGGHSANNWVRIFVATATEGYEMKATLSGEFSVKLRGSFDSGNWGDLVTAIDIFASSPIYVPAINAQYDTMTDTGAEIILQDSGSQNKRDAVFSKGQFYLVKTIDVHDSTEMNSLAAGTMGLLNSDTVSGELLSVQQSMPDTYRDDSQYIPIAEAKNYNNRLLLAGVTEVLPSGDTFLNGQVAPLNDTNYNPNTHIYGLRFKIVDSTTGESHYVLAKYRNGGTDLYPGCFVLSGSNFRLEYGNAIPSGEMYPCVPYAWICYPDTRCQEVEVYFYGNNRTRKIAMEPHPYLECACAFFGFGTKLYEAGSATTSSQLDENENNTIAESNKLLLSEFENPFLFTAGNIITFADPLVGVASTSVPLSQGQFGQFPLYAFTEGGIQALTTTAEGTIAANYAHPNLSRHVAIAGSIFSLEQAVVFITKKGVMMLSGNSVAEISRHMDGKPYVLDSSLGDSSNGVLIGSDWGGLLDSTKAKETFMEFMNGARIAYDNNGARLIFFRNNKGYQYEYRLETQTWHKIQTGIMDAKVLNSYPDCLISYAYSDTSTTPATNVAKVIDFSTILNSYSVITQATSVQYGIPVFGIIVTRPFDLGEPDIRKAIRSIRVRGNYNRQDVQYLLLGSFDGLNWKLLDSLRGGSYKLFRIVLLTKMQPTERITWIDVDYETRFTNKLR